MGNLVSVREYYVEFATNIDYLGARTVEDQCVVL